MRAVLVGLLFVLMLGVREFHVHFPGDLGSRAATAIGFLWLFGFLLGEMISRLSVPRITGYLLAGVVCGPFLLGLVDREVVSHMAIVDRLALSLIAFTAGAELRFERLRARIGALLGVTGIQTAVVFALCAGALWSLQGAVPLFEGQASGTVLAAVLLLGLIATAKSPATTVAVIVECRARGPMTDAILGITVIKDIVVLICFSLLVSLVLPALGAAALRGPGVPSAGVVLVEVLLSLPAGALFGLIMIAYFRLVGRQKALFVVAAAFLLLSLSDAFGLDPLLCAVVAGFAVSNFSGQGRVFTEGLERAAGPVFLVFFCLAGAALDLSVLAGLWPVVLLYLALRTGSMFIGTWLGALAVGESEEFRRYGFTGFLGQAGVSLGLATLVRAQLPGMGSAIADLVVGGIVINQVFGPIAFRWALVRSREAQGSRADEEATGCRTGGEKQAPEPHIDSSMKSS
ncbi:MAG: cation:proton antiporter [Deltaproteobacteria bacterium]|nr:cation:proton antiporter [Deltaproteobacteria bacterium]